MLRVGGHSTLHSGGGGGLPAITIVYEMYEGVPGMSKRLQFTMPPARRNNKPNKTNTKSGGGGITAGGAGGCHTVRGLMVERLAFQESKIGHNNHFDLDWASC